ncbi:TonB family protein [bacterium]|nr:TonB family protein [bacterium]
MNGIATHNELRRDYYHGALFVESLSNSAETLVSQSSAQKMVLHIVIDEWSPRRFSQHWNQSILINNSAEDRGRYANDIATFKKLISSPLVKGDEFVIEKIPGKATLIKLNDTTLMRAKSGFFPLLLNTWIGSRPPSSEFKSSILSLGSDAATKQVINEFNQLQPTQQRKRTVASWIRKPEPPKPVVSAPRPAPKPAPKPAVVAKPKPAPKPVAVTKPAPKPAPKPIAVTKPVPKPAPKPAATVVTLPKATTKPVIKPANPVSQAKPAPAPVAVNKPAPAPAPKPAPAPIAKAAPAPAPKPAPVAAAKPAAEKKSQDNQEGLLRIYRSNLLKLTYRHVIYPDSAIDRNQEGDVVLRVIVNRKGRVKDVGFAQKASFEPLNRSALKAVKNAGPFPAPPKKLEGDNFEIVMPIKFRLPS